MFNVRDGLGIRLLIKAGIQVCIVTGRSSKALFYRCENLKIKYMFDGIGDKAAICDNICDQAGVNASEIAFVGDDLPDLSLMKKVGFAIAVAGAHELVIKSADMVTTAQGGSGAVREACEEILKAKGLWEEILKNYL